MNEFIDRYRELETRMKHHAEKDGGIYLPNIEPRGPVDYIFICMEPSLGEWAKNGEEARRKVEAGFRNFVDGYNAMVLHYSIRRFLCERNQTYHLTDFSKKAMLTKEAKLLKAQNYAKWYPLLVEEVSLLAGTDTRVFAVGGQVARSLMDYGFCRKVIPIIHYSSIAAMHHRKFCEANAQAFSEFKNTVNQEDFLAVAEDVINDSGMPEKMCEEVFTRLCRSSLRTSGIELMFNYYNRFKAVRSV